MGDDSEGTAAAWRTVRIGLLMLFVGTGGFVLAAGVLYVVLLPYLMRAPGAQIQEPVGHEVLLDLVSIAMAALLAGALSLSAVMILFGLIRSLWAPKAKGWMIGTLCCLALMCPPTFCLRGSHLDARDGELALLILLLGYVVLVTLFQAQLAWHFGNQHLVAACLLFLGAILFSWFFLLARRRFVLSEHQDLFGRFDLEFHGVVVLVSVWHLALLWRTYRSIPA